MFQNHSLFDLKDLESLSDFKQGLAGRGLFAPTLVMLQH